MSGDGSWTADSVIGENKDVALFGQPEQITNQILTWQVSEFWMPALIGAVALPLLALLGYALNRLPQPTEEDIAL